MNKNLKKRGVKVTSDEDSFRIDYLDRDKISVWRFLSGYGVGQDKRLKEDGTPLIKKSSQNKNKIEKD